MMKNFPRQPRLWERGSAPFWDDDHISRGMLRAHLDPASDAASRRPEIIERSAAWLADMISPGSRILDLGCGPGLYAQRLSARGYAVVGMDLSRRSIDYARAHDPKTEYHCQNYLTMDFCNEFDVVLLIYCDFAALIPDERQRLLAAVSAALKPDGRFIFDVFTPAYPHETAGTRSWYPFRAGEFWSAESGLCLNASYSYEENRVFAQQHIILTDSGIKNYLIWDTRYTKESLSAELAAAGFSLQSLWGDVCGAPYTAEAATLCAVAEKVKKPFSRE